MYKGKLLGIGVVATLLLTSFVMAETHTSLEEKMSKIVNCSGQPPAVEWSRTYGTSNDDVLRYVQQTDDGGYIGVGVWNGDSHWLLKVDADGNEEWSVSALSDPDHWPRAYVVQQTSDGGYITAGCHEDPYGAYLYGYNRCLWKVDAAGATEWLKLYSDPAFGYHMCIQETSDGGFIVCGEKDEIQLEGFNWNVFLMKTDSLGNREWQKVYSYGPYGDNAYGVRQTPDGGYILCGRVELDAYYGNADLLIIKTDSKGEIEWDKTYGGAEFEWTQSHDIVLTSDGGYLFVGQCESFGAGNQDIWLVKTDAQGNMEWNETYGGRKLDMSGSIISSGDGGYTIVGTYNANENFKPASEGWLIKTDTNGNVQWSQILGGDSADQAQCVSPTSDGGYIVSGNTRSYGAGGYDGWLVKIAPDHDMETPEMTVRKPRPGYIFLFDILGFPFPFTKNALVLGDLTFTADCSDASGISQVEFFIDDILAETVTEEPYTYEWTGAEKGTYNVKIRAYNMYGGTCKEEVTIQKIF